MKKTTWFIIYRLDKSGVKQFLSTTKRPSFNYIDTAPPYMYPTEHTANYMAATLTREGYGNCQVTTAELSIQE